MAPQRQGSGGTSGSGYVVDNVIIFYRIAWTDPPTMRDMLSQAALGRQPRENDPETLRRWQGISLFDSVERARRIGKRFPWNGNAYIATLAIPSGRFQIEQTGRRGHYTLWGEPHDILATVTDVQPI